jgi:PAS domain S-box-containing protein
MTGRHFQQLVDPVRNYAIFLLDARGYITSWNQGAERLKGYEASEIINSHFSIFHPAESIKAGWPERELELAQLEGRFEVEGWRLRKDGSGFWASVTITALRNEGGILEGFLKVTRDLTARIEAEEQRARLAGEQAAREAAEESERRALFLAEAGQALTASLEEEQIYQIVAQVAVPFLGDLCIVDRLENGCVARLAATHQSKSSDSDLGSLLRDYYPIRPSDEHLTAEVLRTGETRFFSDQKNQSKHAFNGDKNRLGPLGALSAHSAIVVPLINRGDVLGVISFGLIDRNREYAVTDVTLAQDLAQRVCSAVEHACLYASAQEAQRKAEAASKAKDRFLAVLSHELRTPLTPILFSASLLIEDPDISKEAREHLQTILINAELEARLIDDLLDVTRISKGKLRLNLTIVDGHEVLLAALETCSPEIRNKQMLVSIELNATNCRARADVDRLQQVFWNLLKNSVKFTEPGGRIVVRSMNLPAGLLRIEVEDSGRGISPELAPRIFDPFEQGKDSEGLGLGLTISKSIVELHGGHISVRSQGLGQGSTFVVEIPVLND